MFELPPVAAFHETRADFVYDRASMMAIPPLMRELYVRAVASVLKPTAGLMVERPSREEGDESGPISASPRIRCRPSTRQPRGAVTR
ncbi:hypothetical protein GH5_04073 [Leishmania sp. Ghana 2012 LV757]|uniref:hypothetical protein n=1 Tax=Leishmania sp. Ghana 2012 LV757 TaxID=2803181 RepID=UPI001B6D9E37|nr:hypothetical protein GH5_04073 [Leishmania sp. Ghana 2012 LV757]